MLCAPAPTSPRWTLPRKNEGKPAPEPGKSCVGAVASPKILSASGAGGLDAGGVSTGGLEGSRTVTSRPVSMALRRASVLATSQSIYDVNSGPGLNHSPSALALKSSNCWWSTCSRA